jgi:TonB-linked SusC/RagA family outer membrane protein
MDLMALFNCPLYEGLTKTLRIMRLTAFFILAACLQSQAKGFSQTVTLSEKKAPLEKVLKDIKRQTGYNFLYDVDLLQQAAPVDLEVRNASLESVLAKCFSNQPFSYTIAGKVIVLSRKEPSKAEQLSMPPPTDIHGRITDSTGAPLEGASITVKGSKGKGTTTDAKGEFDLKNVDPNATIIISFTGFESREIRLSNNPGLQSGGLKITLAHKTSQLDDVQIIAYGTTSQRLSTGDVSTVKASDIEKQPINNPLLALEGAVPGLFVTQNTGVPGGGLNIVIRGQNSIANGIDPFFVIDGVPYISQLPPDLGYNTLQQTNGNFAQGAGNPLSFINPSDIESISILKDADATAIYGSRAANGAILITTKKGKSGKTALDVNVYSGAGTVAKKADWLNTSQYLQMRHEALNNDGVTPSLAGGDYDLLEWDTTRYTNWQKALIGEAARYNDAQLALSGGNSVTQYYLGGGYHSESTVFPFNGGDHKGSLHFNITNTSADQKFKMAFSGTYMDDNRNLPGTDLTGYASTPPDAPNLYNSDGTLNWANATWPGGNPISYTRQVYHTLADNLVSNAIFSYNVLSGLKISTNFGYTNMAITETSTDPIAAQNPAFLPTGSNGFTNNNVRSWSIEPQLSYRLAFKASTIQALVGTAFQQNNTDGKVLNGSGYTSDALLQNIQAAPTLTVTSVTSTLYKYNRIFGIVNYNYNDKYILNLNLDRDGSSRFGPDEQFHDFGSLGAAWIFTNEDVIKNHFPALSFGKLHASYGTTGNDQIGDYRFYNLFNSSRYPYQGAPGLIPAGLYNPDIAWELTKKTEAGVVLGFLKDRILLNASYYYNQSSNQLLSYTLPAITGFSSVQANFPATVQNVGWELFLNTTNIKSKNFGWKSSINLTVPRNKVTKFPGLASSSYAGSLQIGKPINIQEVFHMIGVNDTTGVYEFATSKGSPTYSPNYGTDNTTVIKLDPVYYGGFSNSFTYKGFQLDILFQFTKRTGTNYLFQPFAPPGLFGTNWGRDVLSRWQKPGDKASIEQFTESYSSNAYAGYANAQLSDRAYTDASFVRLKNLSLSYQLPSGWMKKAHLHNCSIYVHGQNLWTFTKYRGMDPESLSIYALPPLRVITGGIQLSL